MIEVTGIMDSNGNSLWVKETPKLPQPTVTKKSGESTGFNNKITATFKTTSISGVTYYIKYSWTGTPANPTSESYDYKGTGSDVNSTFDRLFESLRNSYTACRIKVIGTKPGYLDSDVKSVTLNQGPK